MRLLHPSRLELRRFMRGRLTRVALVAVVMLPLLYAGLYLWSFWDPQGHLERVPVALVVEDQPAINDGKTVDAGRDLADELVQRKVFDWHRVDAAEADKGVRDGKYYLSLTIPRNFSADLTSPSEDGTPHPAQLGIRVDTGRSYIMRTISDSVFAEVKDASDRTAVRGYLDQIFLSLDDLHNQTKKAADGADQLHNGAADASKGAATLNDGLGTAQDATHQLSAGANQLHSGSRQLAGGVHDAYTGSRSLTAGLSTAAKGVADLRKGLTDLNKGAGTLAGGNKEAYEQVHALSPTINNAADKFVPVLDKNGELIRKAALTIATGADAFADALNGLPQQVESAAGSAQDDLRAIDRWLSAHPDADPELRALVERASGSAGDLTDAAARLQSRLESQAGRIDELAETARTVADDARELAAAAPTLGKTLDDARDKFNELDKGLKQLSDGAAQLYDGTGKALTGAKSLYGGVGRLKGGANQLSSGLAQLDTGAAQLNSGAGSLASGAGQLDSGIGQLHHGAGRLDSGLTQLKDGSGELANKLGDGAAQIPDYGKSARDSRTNMMSDPVRLDSEIDNKVPNYGTGFAPFFVPLALWVGAMVIYMLLRPMNPRLLAGSSSAWRTTLAGWLPAMTMGALQVAVLLAVLRVGLGLTAVHWFGAIGFLLLTAAAFLALIQAVNAHLGAPGRAVVLALLMLQLTSSAGTYPIETSPAFFQAISPWLPMSWVVSAMRRLISGGDLTIVWQACGVLTAFLVLGLSLTVLAVQRGRTWSMRRLKPELTL